VSKRQRPKDRERFGKKYYDGKGLRCATCGKHSHEKSWCPAAQVRPEDPALRCAWADQLIDGERVRVEVYEGLTREEAIARFDSQGAEFNKGNPAAVEAGGQATLKSRLGYWKALGADRVALSWVWYGVPMPFAEPPPREHWANAKSAVQHAEFVDKTIAEQVALGNFVEVAPEFAEVIHPLMVEVNGKKPRMCVNMIPTNSFLAGQPFRQEMLAKVGLDVVRPDSHLLVADLKSAYYSVQMRQEALPWNCFMWEGKCYSARSLLFGNSLGPWFFTKLGRPILGFLRTIGVPCTAYVDGGHLARTGTSTGTGMSMSTSTSTSQTRALAHTTTPTHRFLGIRRPRRQRSGGTPTQEAPPGPRVESQPEVGAGRRNDQDVHGLHHQH
jgi:hypothetical protein